jgi:hypothetical protein
MRVTVSIIIGSGMDGGLSGIAVRRGPLQTGAARAAVDATNASFQVSRPP